MNADSAAQTSAVNAQGPKEPQESPVKKNTSSDVFNKYFPLLLIIIIIIILAMFSVIFSKPKIQKTQPAVANPYNQTQQVTNSAPETNATINPVPIHNSSTQKAPINNSACGSVKPTTTYSGWITYQDPSTCITFSYPNDWKLTTNLNTITLVKDGYHIALGISVGDAPVVIYSAKSKNVQLLGKTYSSIYTYAANDACNNFDGSGNTIVTPVPSVCTTMFDTIAVTDPLCFNGSICTGQAWPLFINWQFNPKRPTPTGFFIQFSTPTPTNLSAASTNTYINDFYQVITTVNLPQVINYQ